jgi:hypothetical protein
MPSRRALTLGLVWLAVIAGGFLQFAYTETKHHSLLLKVWGATYAILGLIALLSVLAYGFYRLRDWRTRRRA